MEARKFAVGDRVRLLLDGSHPHGSPADVYTVSRALPAEAKAWQYRVKRVADGQERAVSEQQLAKAVLSADRSTAEAQQDIQRIRNARAASRAREMARRSEERPS
ncbi:MAG TPA: hypothetical protein VH855_04000 [Acetobacteraceae bacterium]|jgi:hypothetical protein